MYTHSEAFAMTAALGRELREKVFFLDKDIVCINHGSYGTVPRQVLDTQRRLQAEIERHPDGFYRRRNPALHLTSLESLCGEVGARPEDTVFVENATTGMNCVLQSLKLAGDDAVLLSSLQYHGFIKIAEQFAPKVIKVDLSFPLETEEDILAPYKKCLEENPNIKVAILDHITSPTSVLMPLKKMAALCRQFGVLTAVDGAHVVGQLPLNIQELDVDFYTGNLHKWMFTPRGSAFLWVEPRHRDVIRPCVVSHFHGTSLHFDFVVGATRDHTPYHCVPAAIAFQKQLGGLAKVTLYVTALLEEAVVALERAWHTQRLAVAPSLQAPFMRLIRLPDMANYDKTAVGAGDLDFALFDQFKVQSICMLIAGQLYIRLSAHVYNCLDDYLKLRDAILVMRDEPRRPNISKGYELPIMHWDMSMWAKETQRTPNV